MTRMIGIICLAAVLAAAGAEAKKGEIDPPRTVRQASLYADVKARSVGDIVTVAIVERASGSNSSKLSTRRNTQFQNNADEGTGILDFFPDFGMNAEFDRSHDGSGQLSREGRLTANMAATVTQVMPNGDLLIQGEREIGINDETEILSLSGVIRPEDIGAGNMVYSTDIANAQISYKGKGVVTSGSRPNIFVRLLSWIF
ncbi:MAG: flagellar basal body L-ring protein FlgH [Candidatus Eisenbacteria bacterium]|nr:flagellar basal body L-ring protein FlgH [Candidatus Eisenbacteria bacterium]